MRTTIATSLLILILSAPAFCQTEIYRDASVLDKVEQLYSLDPAKKVTEVTHIKDPLPLYSHTPADSLALQYHEFTITKNIVRLDPEKVKIAFPEVVTTSTDGYSEVDYISLIPVLLEVIRKQNELLNQLNDRIIQIEEVLSR